MTNQYAAFLLRHVATFLEPGEINGRIAHEAGDPNEQLNELCHQLHRAGITLKLPRIEFVKPPVKEDLVMKKLMGKA